MTSAVPIAHSVVYRFDRFELVPETEELRKNGTRIHLPPQPFRVLQLLVERAGEIVTREEIQRTLWGDEVFVDYEQGINTAIRRIRFALNDNAEMPRFLQTLPRRGYCFVGRVEVVASAPARVEPLRVVEEAAWVADSVPSAGPRRRRFSIAAMFALIATLLFTRAPHDSSTAAKVCPTLRIAIAPLAVDPTRKVPLDPRRITDELQTHLSRLQPQVVAVVEAGQPSDIRIEGTLQDAGKAIRLNARILETKTGNVVWAESLNREGDAADFPLEAALRMTRAVASRYLSKGREEPLVHTIVRPEVLALYREARQLATKPLPQKDLDGALTRLQKAVQLEPDFAEAWSGIGDIWSERAELWIGESRTVALTQARIALERAIAIDPKCAEALNDYGRLLMKHDRNYAEAEEWMRRAIAADPDYVHSYVNLAVLLTAMGQYDGGIAMFRQYQVRDPNASVPSVMLAFLYLMAQRPDDAMAEYHAALLVEVNPNQARWGMVWSSMAAQRWSEAATSLAAVLQEPVHLGNHPDSASRYREEFRRLEPILEARARGRLLDPYVLACFYSNIHDADRAFTALDASIAGDSTLAVFAFVDPRLDYIRTDPRFNARLEKLGFRR